VVNASLSSVLRSGRDQFNALFAATRHQYPDLDGEAFKEFVVRSIEPLAAAVDVKHAARTASVVQAAFEIGLELAGQRLVGRGARHAFIEAGWQRILPRYSAMLAERPLELLGAVSNALHQLATTPGARPEEWITDLAELSVLVPNFECFLRVGQVCAWRAGLAHYRRGALQAADELGETLGSAALRVADGADWSSVRARLAADPWFDPAKSATPAARWVGGFRGFGGLFAEPPRVALSGGHVIVKSGESAWLLVADAFGATFHRATSDEERAASVPAIPKALALKGSRLILRGKPLALDPRGELTSGVIDGTTVVFTGALTHKIAVCSVHGATP
jgi:hypothetical protein